jgi:hypothetical protein
MKVYFPTTILLAIASLFVTVAANRPSNENQPVKASPEIIGIRYCSGDTETFSVWLSLRVKYLNRTDKTLILDKEIGKRWYSEKVARSPEDLAAGKFEYNPIIDWFFTEKDKLPTRPPTGSPNSDFVVLTPGQIFESEIDPAIVAQYENPKNFAGTVRPGVHLFQMELSAWNHPGEPDEFAKSWQKFGALVTGVVKTDPLEIQIPSHPKVEMECR